MKLHEIASAPGNNMKRLYMLKHMIDTGQQPEVLEAGYSAGHFSFGDLEEIGYAERGRRGLGRRGSEDWWVYTGPKPIVAVYPKAHYDQSGKMTQSEVKQLMKKGDRTEPVETDAEPSGRPSPIRGPMFTTYD